MKHIPFRLVRSCPYCQSTDVLRSRRQGLLERLALRVLLIRPYRCQTCTRRHYNFVFTHRVPPPEATQQGPE